MAEKEQAIRALAKQNPVKAAAVAGLLGLTDLAKEIKAKTAPAVQAKETKKQTEQPSLANSPVTQEPVVTVTIGKAEKPTSSTGLLAQIDTLMEKAAGSAEKVEVAVKTVQTEKDGLKELKTAVDSIKVESIEKQPDAKALKNEIKMIRSELDGLAKNYKQQLTDLSSAKGLIQTETGKIKNIEAQLKTGVVAEMQKLTDEVNNSGVVIEKQLAKVEKANNEIVSIKAQAGQLRARLGAINVQIVELEKKKRENNLDNAQHVDIGGTNGKSSYEKYLAASRDELVGAGRKTS